MVSFSCDDCGDLLRKQQVDGHVYKCRSGCRSVSCVDCNVSFYGDDYRAHTTCMTEAERYEKRGAHATKKAKKRTPQEDWMDLIVHLASNASSEKYDPCPQHLRAYFQTLAGLDNVPRKEKQFRNFAANSLNLRRGPQSETIVGDMFAYLQKQREKQQQAKAVKANATSEEKSSTEASITVSSSSAEERKERDQSEQRETKTTSSETDKKSSKKKKASKSKSTITKKTVKKAMKKVLKKAKNQSLSLNALKSAVENRLTATKDDDTQELETLIRKTVKRKKDTFVVKDQTIQLIVS